MILTSSEVRRLCELTSGDALDKVLHQRFSRILLKFPDALIESTDSTPVYMEEDREFAAMAAKIIPGLREKEVLAIIVRGEARRAFLERIVQNNARVKRWGPRGRLLLEQGAEVVFLSATGNADAFGRGQRFKHIIVMED